MASLAVLTVAVGEVEVSLGTGIAALPRVIGLAVTAAGEVLTGAIGEVRFAVTACREGQAAVAITDQTLGSHKHSRGIAVTQNLCKSHHHLIQIPSRNKKE